MSILTIQQKLKAAGFDPGPLDGLIGGRTLAALDAALARHPAVSACSDMDPQFFADMRSDLEGDEGRKAYAYKDSLGYWTIGVGRLIDKARGGCLSDDEIDYLLANDIRRKFDDLARRVPAWRSVKGDPVRMRGMLNMAFQMGVDGLLHFENSLKLIEAKDWKGAAANLRKSLWFTQTPARSERVIRMIETGRA